MFSGQFIFPVEWAEDEVNLIVPGEDMGLKNGSSSPDQCGSVGPVWLSWLSGIPQSERSWV